MELQVWNTEHLFLVACVGVLDSGGRKNTEAMAIAIAVFQPLCDSAGPQRIRTYLFDISYEVDQKLMIPKVHLVHYDVYVFCRHSDPYSE